MLAGLSSRRVFRLAGAWVVQSRVHHARPHGSARSWTWVSAMTPWREAALAIATDDLVSAADLLAATGSVAGGRRSPLGCAPAHGSRPPRGSAGTARVGASCSIAASERREPCARASRRSLRELGPPQRRELDRRPAGRGPAVDAAWSPRRGRRRRGRRGCSRAMVARGPDSQIVTSGRSRGRSAPPSAGSRRYGMRCGCLRCSPSPARPSPARLRARRPRRGADHRRPPPPPGCPARRRGRSRRRRGTRPSEPAHGDLRLGLVGRGDHDRALGDEHEGGLRRVGVEPDSGTPSSGDVAGCEVLERPHVQHLGAVREALEPGGLGWAARKRPRLSSTIRSMFGGYVEIAADSATKRATSPNASAGLKRRLNPTVVDAFELIAFPHSDPRRGRDTPRRRRRARRAGEGSGRACAFACLDREIPRRSAFVPTNNESPVSTSQGSSPRERSTSRQQCSGRWPGVWMQRSTTSPSSISAPSSIGSCGILPRLPRGDGR